MKNEPYIVRLRDVSLNDISTVGGKNASLGEMYRELVPQGVNVPDGFVVNANAYWLLLKENGLKPLLEQELKALDTNTFSNLQEVGEACRKLMRQATLPTILEDQMLKAFTHLQSMYETCIQVAVRSSATAEDLPEASFAGQQESFLNIQSDQELLKACHACYVSLFTDRAIKYRSDHGFEHMQVALSIGVQKMVRSDKACAGVSFTLDTETGFNKVVSISGSWGLGENVVKGNVSPDEFCVFKPSLTRGQHSILFKNLGKKEKTMTYQATDFGELGSINSKTINDNTSIQKQEQFVLSDVEIEQIARWSVLIEEHYKRPMDIEWAKDGVDGKIYIVQARPETVHTLNKTYRFFDYKLLSKGEIIAEGKNVGNKIASGKARLLHDPSEIKQLKEGEVLVTEITNPDWDPVLKKAAAIVTDRGGRTSHAAIVARETGAIAVVGTGDGTHKIKEGQMVTVSCAEGKKGLVYEGALDWETSEVDTQDIVLPETEVKFILADPDQAFKLSFLPNKGVGLMRLEFVINHNIKIHPLALVNFDALKDQKAKDEIDRLTKGYSSKEDYFTDKLSQAVATIAAAFHPNEVIVRMSDFKSNEYANLLGGREFEPHEENPMLGWRGASRYYSAYSEGFRLECEAMKIVRDKMGLTNVKLMVPFCRTVEEAQKVLKIMQDFGLKRGENGLEVYLMVEIPSNVILADVFANYFDGFSIGSNDLTQLTLGIDRDSEILSPLFDAENEAVKQLIKQVIKVAHQKKIKIGLCGQAPSDSLEFAAFLVKLGIDSVSFNPDALLKGIETISAVEKKEKQKMVEH